MNNRVFLIPGVGHFIPKIKPKEFNAALEVIVAKLQSSLKNAYNERRQTDPVAEDRF